MKGKKPAAAKSECVKVAIRVRPMNKHEKEQKSTLCVDVDTANNTVAVNSNYSRPLISNGIHHIKIQDGRHPVVEQQNQEEKYK